MYYIHTNKKVPTFEVFYRGDMVSKINGPRINEVKEVSKLCHIIIYVCPLYVTSSSIAKINGPRINEVQEVCLRPN